MRLSTVRKTGSSSSTTTRTGLVVLVAGVVRLGARFMGLTT
jgi:hypothetical protein